MSYCLHEDAEAELGDAAVYCALRDEGLRIYPFRRFPYSVVYREDGDAGPQVYAIAHQRLEPGYWQRRL